jgi:enoyl-CoA hydratase/carnithine racemase
VAGSLIRKFRLPAAVHRHGVKTAWCGGKVMSADMKKNDGPLLIERHGAVETLVINDAPRNRMGLEFMDALEAEVARLADDSGVRAVVIRGAGDENFSVGMDLKQLPEGVARMGSLEAVLDQRLRVLSAIENLPKPVIAVLYGYCLGGGLELPLACHFRLAAAEGARIGLPELDLGTVPAWGGSARLTRCIGRNHALDMILRAKKISGPEALRIGLVNEVWPIDDLFQRARDLALELAKMPAVAVRGMLRCVVGAGEKSLAEALAEERRAVLSTMGTPDQREGMLAFLEKRKPRFNRESE